MWLWKRVIKPGLEWIGLLDTIHNIAQAEFIRTMLTPVVATAMTAISGYLGGVPTMWVLVGCGLMFASVTTGMLRGSQYIERKNPLNKIRYVGTDFGCDLHPAQVPAQLNLPNLNRQSRRAATKQKQSRDLGPTEIHPGVPRTMDKAKIGVTVKNVATFPISCLMDMAQTDVEGITPPRGQFPRDRMTLLPGSIVTFRDDTIEMDGHPCGRLTGNMDILLKYGLPGKENFELKFKAVLDIHMEAFGVVTSVHSRWVD